MAEQEEFRCFIGNLSWSTSDRDLKDAFKKFGRLLDAKVFMLLLCISVLYLPILGFIVFYFGSSALLSDTTVMLSNMSATVLLYLHVNFCVYHLILE